MRTTKVITVSLPADLLKLADTMAKQEGRTRSELVREALREYAETSRWRRLRHWGEASARSAGVADAADIEQAVTEVRDRKL